MPRFFFDTDDDSEQMTDVYGIELADQHAARDVAVETLPELAQDALPVSDQHKVTVHVSDQNHEAVLDASLSLDVDWKQAVAPEARSAP